MIINILLSIITITHIYTLYIEMFAWETKGREAFKGILDPDVFTPAKALAANLGLYNGFLAAGIGWSMFISDPLWKLHVATFFLVCIVIAGVYGAFTGSRKIFCFQALPAIVALALILIRDRTP